MTIPTANGVDVLLVAFALIVVLVVGLYASWRADDRLRRLERLRERRMG